MLVEDRRFELQHFGLIDFEDHRAADPRQSPGPGVQPGGQDDDLLDAVGTGRGG